MELPLTSASGQEAGSVQVAMRVFSAPLRSDLLQRAVRQELAGKRQGTAHGKSRGEVRGGGRKPWKQKGTGRARVGSIRSPIWVGGGKAFPPKPRDFSFSLPRHVVKYSLRSALSVKRAQRELEIWPELTVGGGKTKLAADVLKQRGWKSVLFVDHGRSIDRADNDFAKAVANVAHVTLLSAAKLTVYPILGHQQLVLSSAAAEYLSAELNQHRGAKKVRDIEARAKLFPRLAVESEQTAEQQQQK